IDVSVSFSGLAVEVVRTEHDFERATPADERRKAFVAAAAGMHARADFHLRQGRVLSRGESHVAGEEELARYPAGPAPDLRDADNRRLGETNERIQQRREAGGPDSLEQAEGPLRVFHLKVSEIEVGIRALEYDDTKALAGVHAREYFLQTLEHVGVHDVERRIIEHHSPVRRRFLDDAQVRR